MYDCRTERTVVYRNFGARFDKRWDRLSEYSKRWVKIWIDAKSEDIQFTASEWGWHQHLHLIAHYSVICRNLQNRLSETDPWQPRRPPCAKQQRPDDHRRADGRFTRAQEVLLQLIKYRKWLAPPFDSSGNVYEGTSWSAAQTVGQSCEAGGEAGVGVGVHKKEHSQFCTPSLAALTLTFKCSHLSDIN